MFDNATEAADFSTEMADLTTAVSDGQELDFYYKMSEKILTYVNPVLMVVGVVGNILMFATVQRRAMRTSPVSV